MSPQCLTMIFSSVIYLFFGFISALPVHQSNQRKVKTDSISLVGINNRSLELSQTLDTVTSLLSPKKKISRFSQKKVAISPKERVRLIRMVHKVVQLANEVLDLNYTTTNPIESKIFDLQPKNKTFSVVGEVIPVNLLTPCGSSDPNFVKPKNDPFHNTIDSSSNHDEDEISLDDYDLMDFNDHSRKAIQNSHNLVGKFKIGFELLQEMIYRANHLKGLVSDLIRKNLIKDCMKLEVPHIFQIPYTPHDNISDTLTTIYQSLANQTAHLYFIWSEQKRQFNNQNDDDVSCMMYRSLELSMSTETGNDNNNNNNKYQPKLTPTPTIHNNNHNDNNSNMNNSKLIHQTSEKLDWIPRINSEKLQQQNQLRSIGNDFLLVSNNLRILMCYLSQAIHLFDIPVPIEQIVQQVLQHRIRYTRSCARRSVFECQLMRDAVRFFSDIEEFLRNESHRFLNSEKDDNLNWH